MSKVGLLFVGLNCGVSTTSLMGAVAIGKGLIEPLGLYTETLTSPVVNGKLDRQNQESIKKVLGLLDYSDAVFGGWDIVNESVLESARKLKIIPDTEIDRIAEDIKDIQSWPGVFSQEYIQNLKPEKSLEGTLYEQAQQIRTNIREFKVKHNLEQVVIFNCASTEAYHELTKVHQTLENFENAMKENSSEIGPGQVYAYAGIMEGCGYVNFTPSMTAEIPALEQLSIEKRVPITGKDGKTGQTLVKTVIAPLFRLKNLQVDGWFSTNILGNKDGLVLDDPGSFESKRRTKADVLTNMLGYEVRDHIVKINYYRPRGDDKEAWDNIDFRGIFGQPMQLKMNFLCKDSILAAGNVLDLARLMTHLLENKREGGIQEQLSFFFKAPYTSGGKQAIHEFFKQEGMLKDWIREERYGVGYKE